MLRNKTDPKNCINDSKDNNKLYQEIPPVVKKLAASCNKRGCFDHLGSIPIPTYEKIVEIIEQTRRILFPGYYSTTAITPANLEYYLGQETTELFEKLSNQISLAIQHECFKSRDACLNCTENGH